MSVELCATRFNCKTWEENCVYRRERNLQGCIYGAPKQISPGIKYNGYVIVLEMLNLTPKENKGSGGKIMGIGLIHNKYLNKSPKIYEQGNYNRFIYQSKYRIDRETLQEKEEKVFEYLDAICFYGADHLMRGQGIIKVPYKKIKDYRVEESTIYDYLFSMFCSRFNI